VINALRERANLRKPIAALRRWWQASAALVSLMLITIAGLIALTALAPSSSSQAEISSFNLYSTDAVILNQNMTRDLTTEQIFEVIYDAKSDSDK